VWRRLPHWSRAGLAGSFLDQLSSAAFLAARAVTTSGALSQTISMSAGWDGSIATGSTAAKCSRMIFVSRESRSARLRGDHTQEQPTRELVRHGSDVAAEAVGVAVRGDEVAGEEASLGSPEWPPRAQSPAAVRGAVPQSEAIRERSIAPGGLLIRLPGSASTTALPGLSGSKTNGSPARNPFLDGRHLLPADPYHARIGALDLHGQDHARERRFLAYDVHSCVRKLGSCPATVTRSSTRALHQFMVEYPGSL